MPPDLVSLTEILARNAHDLWAARRLADGWRYGPEWDRERKRTPNLVSYEELPDHEREVDRAMAMETLKVLLLRGFEIRKNGVGQPVP